MIKKILPMLIVPVVLLSGYGTVYNNITSDYDRSVDFTRYKTFAWLPDNADTVNSPYNNQIIRNNIRNYFSQCMSDRGYAVDVENPDLLLQVMITNAKKERTVTSSAYAPAYYYRPYYFGSLYHSPYPYRYYYGNPLFSYGYPATMTTQKQEYVEGAITLNLIDKRTRQLVWTGTAKGDIYDPANISKNIHPAVHRIIERYPVKSLTGKDHRPA